MSSDVKTGSSNDSSSVNNFLKQARRLEEVVSSLQLAEKNGELEEEVDRLRHANKDIVLSRDSAISEYKKIAEHLKNALEDLEVSRKKNEEYQFIIEEKDKKISQLLEERKQCEEIMENKPTDVPRVTNEFDWPAFYEYMTKPPAWISHSIAASCGAGSILLALAVHYVAFKKINRRGKIVM